ncbi:MAG: histidinol-phosphate transaminase, partial [Bacillota bacterium]
IKVTEDMDFNRYPDQKVSSLRRKLGEYTGFSMGNIMVGNGSDELLLMIILAFAGDGGQVIIPAPTFGMYEYYARAAGSEIRRLELNPDFSLDWTGLKTELEQSGNSLAFLCSPNNPTGNLLNADQLERCLQESEAMVVLDEAYFEFCGQTLVELVKSYDNLIVTRTLSKAFGLAGLRVGYLVAQTGVIDRLEGVRSPYNVDRFSQQVALKVMEYRHLYREQWELIIKERKRLYTALEALSGVTAYPSQANFVLFRPELPSKQVHQQLKNRGLQLRLLTGLPVAGDCLRITAGQREAGDLFLQSLPEITGG